MTDDEFKEAKRAVGVLANHGVETFFMAKLVAEIERLREVVLGAALEFSELGQDQRAGHFRARVEPTKWDTGKINGPSNWLHRARALALEEAAQVAESYEGAAVDQHTNYKGDFVNDLAPEIAAAIRAIKPPALGDKSR